MKIKAYDYRGEERRIIDGIAELLEPATVYLNEIALDLKKPYVRSGHSKLCDIAKVCMQVLPEIDKDLYKKFENLYNTKRIEMTDGEYTSAYNIEPEYVLLSKDVNIEWACVNTVHEFTHACDGRYTDMLVHEVAPFTGEHLMQKRLKNVLPPPHRFNAVENHFFISAFDSLPKANTISKITSQHYNTFAHYLGAAVAPYLAEGIESKEFTFKNVRKLGDENFYKGMKELGATPNAIKKSLKRFIESNGLLKESVK
jgi:hypothetical protein